MFDLRRILNLPLITFFGLGNILGAGVYLLVGKVAGLVTALVVAAIAFSYAELAARFPDSVGEEIYLQRGFKRKQLSMLGGALIALTGTVFAVTIVRDAG